MHIYLGTRGIKHDVDRMITELQGKYLKGKWNGQDVMIQVAVRPIQLWEIVFPEEHKETMLTTLFGEDGKTQHRRHDKFLWAARKMLGKDVQPLPEKWDTSMSVPLYKNNIEMFGIGIKPDYWVVEDHVKNPTPEQKAKGFEGL